MPRLNSLDAKPWRFSKRLAAVVAHRVCLLVLGCSIVGCGASQTPGTATGTATRSGAGEAATRPVSGSPASATAPAAAANANKPSSPLDFEHLRQQSPVIDRALALKADVEAANEQDLHVLWAHVQDRIRPLNAEARQRLVQEVDARIDSDSARLAQLQKFFREGPVAARPWVAYELHKAIDQLLGAPGEIVGLFEDARTLMARPASTNPFNPDLADMYLEPHLTAGLKMLLVYAAVAVEGVENAGELSLIDDVQLIYSLEIPSGVPKEFIDGLALVDRAGTQPRFLLPNAGFVMGGTFQEGDNRGIDCSAFVSHCTQSSHRLSTWVMEFCWRELVHGAGDFRGEELEVRQEFVDKFGLNEALEEFTAVAFDKLDDLQPGDVLLRRWNHPKSGKREGNSTLFLAPRRDGNVWGIECNRLYNPETGQRKDGVVYRAYNLFQPDVDVYVLRRVERE
jgi:hypothetical protein